ncbi:hypothetical protein JQ634_27800 [Bradyrhizobium sp. AUGA SZCCT0240]|jgi:hypothetical protein|uniref:hypothetical protein n=1 Tax=unclassified Bradyrhizobium TaxID=2631580 RepID=UPI001BAC1D27|nr:MULTISPECIES: hypothetical protein [unclassified Bradyrhizobium]MBR1196221.1 hypothetical protein [Bradyrhizobium sp. AUGA SZCCT0158]MBR1243189.1 hypothetical protein [Bradyrhizobium sp. AUGA SZCCT0274]MBR1257480.1 hypothetical protein [Bradyrhizobium sp. AUGA SZCCT0240]
MTEVTYGKYLFEYRFKDAEWGFEIIATSPQEARERLRAISWAQYKGEVFARVSATSAPMLKIATRIRSMLGL